MSNHGIESPLWLSHRIIEMAHPLYLRKAVKDVISHLEEVTASGTSPYEIIDRLVQVAATGEYKPPPPVEEVMRKVIPLKDGKLSPEDEREIQKFLEQLNGVPEAEQLDEDDMPYEEWLKKMGIPTEDDEGDEDDQE